MFKHLERKRRDDPFLVPEQFLWYVFECLCIAGLLLEHGEMEKNPMGNWTPIVHRDMKLSNVFLSLPSDTNYRCYHMPKLGDFGLAIFLPGGQVSGQDLRGTLDNMPIEQDPRAMSEHGISWPLTSKANVWGIANIVASLLTRKEGFGDWDRFRKYKEAVWYDGDLATYSDELREIIEECMRFDPKDRPDLAYVLNKIRARRLHAQDASLRIAPAYSPIWTRHRIDAEILDLVCTVEGVNTMEALADGSNKQSEAKTKIYRLSGAFDADYPAKVGGEAGTELANVTPRKPRPANRPSSRHSGSFPKNSRKEEPSPTRRSSRRNSGSANAEARNSGSARRSDHRSGRDDAGRDSSLPRGSSSDGLPGPPGLQQEDTIPQFLMPTRQQQGPRTHASIPRFQPPPQATQPPPPETSKPTPPPGRSRSSSYLPSPRPPRGSSASFATLLSPLPSPYLSPYSLPLSPFHPTSPRTPPPPPPPTLQAQQQASQASQPASQAPQPVPQVPQQAPQAPQQVPQAPQLAPQPPQSAPTLASTRARRTVKRKFSNLNVNDLSKPPKRKR